MILLEDCGQHRSSGNLLFETGAFSGQLQAIRKNYDSCDNESGDEEIGPSSNFQSLNHLNVKSLGVLLDRRFKKQRRQTRSQPARQQQQQQPP